jgi:hypothetical protein
LAIEVLAALPQEFIVEEKLQKNYLRATVG